MIIHETLRKNAFSEKSVSDERSRISRHGWVNQYSGCPDLLAKGDQWDAIARGLDPQIYNGRAQVLKFWYSNISKQLTAQGSRCSSAIN